MEPDRRVSGGPVNGPVGPAWSSTPPLVRLTPTGVGSLGSRTGGAGGPGRPDCGPGTEGLRRRTVHSGRVWTPTLRLPFVNI